MGEILLKHFLDCLAGSLLGSGLSGAFVGGLLGILRNGARGGAWGTLAGGIVGSFFGGIYGITLLLIQMGAGTHAPPLMNSLAAWMIDNGNIINSGCYCGGVLGGFIGSALAMALPVNSQQGDCQGGIDWSSASTRSFMTGTAVLGGLFLVFMAGIAVMPYIHDAIPEKNAPVIFTVIALVWFSANAVTLWCFVAHYLKSRTAGSE
jgi:hypothetical protein